MKNLLFGLAAALFLTACSNNADTARTFCDTTCLRDSLKFTGDHQLKPQVTLSINNCLGDTISWTHDALPSERKMQLSTLVGTPVRVSTAAMDHYIKDTSYAWITFNDCVTGRGFLLKLPFDKTKSIVRSSGALNRFDPKFFIEDSLRAHTDRGNVFVVDINTGKEAQMTLGERFPIEFDNIHGTVDSVHITRQRIWIRLLKNGQEVVKEKAISL